MARRFRRATAKIEPEKAREDLSPVDTGEAPPKTAAYLDRLSLSVGGSVRPLERDFKRLADMRTYRELKAAEGEILTYGVFECSLSCSKGG